MSIPALDAEVAEAVDVVVPCRGKIAASDDCAIKATKRKTKLRRGCIGIILKDKETGGRLLTTRGMKGMGRNVVLYLYLKFKHDFI